MKFLHFTVLLSLAATLVESEIDSTTKDGIQSSVDAVITVAEAVKDQKDALVDAGKAVGPLVSSIGSIAPFLGAAGAFLSIILAFLPKEDSAELKYMKDKFSEVNNKLDIITDKLNDIENLITFEAQRAAYISAENDILFGYAKLNEFYAECETTDCDDDVSCLEIRTKIAERFLDHFAKVENSLDLILRNSYTGTYFSEPLLQLVKTRFGCDVGELNSFSESLFRLAEEGEQVVLTYHKLAGSNISAVTSLQKWMDTIYEFRTALYNVKNECYRDISTYASSDVSDVKYQESYSDHVTAMSALSSALESKYAWLRWNIHAYDAFGKKEESFKVVEGFSNAPSSDEERDRVLIATPVDPLATYTVQKKQDIINAINTLTYENLDGCASDKHKCVTEIEQVIRAKGLWEFVQSVTVLKESVTAVFHEAKTNSFINKLFEYTKIYPSANYPSPEQTLKLRINVILMLKSTESNTGSLCQSDSCHGDSLCVQLPYSTVTECQCIPQFDGDRCQEHSPNSLISTLDLLVTSTLQVPTLTDIYFDVKELQQSFETGQTVITSVLQGLQGELEDKFDELSEELGQNFQWTNLNVNYASTINDLQHFIREFQIRSKEDGDARGKELAEYILAPGRIKQWIYNLDVLFKGSQVIVQDHPPLMIAYMDRYSNDACSITYKTSIDNAYRQFSILQHQAYVMWAEALDILQKKTEEVGTVYQERLKEQDERFGESTCVYDIPHSINVKCTNGRYTHPGLTLQNQCETNFYIKGPVESKCNDVIKSSCLSCACNVQGRDNAECTDQDGVCSCKSVTYQTDKTTSYYGDKCQNIDCKWGHWSGYGSCSKSCNYGGQYSRSRSRQILKMGVGQDCSGVTSESKSCFEGCCSNQFHCSSKSTCISSSLACNYKNDCGNNQDESDSICGESCYFRYTSWHSAGSGNVWYLDRQEGSCYNIDVLQSLQLERSGSSQRYIMRCCKWHVPGLTSRHNKNNGLTHISTIVGLKHQDINCNSDREMLHSFVIDGEWKKKNWYDTSKSFFIKYSYKCDKVISLSYKTSCKIGNTSKKSKGDGKTPVLDSINIDCSAKFGQRWFLNQFQLQESSGQIWYRFKCCRIVS